LRCDEKKEETDMEPFTTRFSLILLVGAPKDSGVGARWPTWKLFLTTI
jgi:hypothetical protein